MSSLLLVVIGMPDTLESQLASLIGCSSAKLTFGTFEGTVDENPLIYALSPSAAAESSHSTLRPALYTRVAARFTHWRLEENHLAPDVRQGHEHFGRR